MFTCVVFYVLLLIVPSTVATHQPGLVPLVLPLTGPGGNIQALYWDSQDQVLIYSNATDMTIHRLDPANLRNSVIQLDEPPPNLVIPTKGYDGRFITTSGRNLLYLFWDYQVTNFFDFCLITTVEPYCQGNKWHLGKADQRGNVWAGTGGPELQNDMNVPNKAAFFRVDIGKAGKASVSLARAPVTFSNGVEWTTDSRTLYYSDGGETVIHAYDFDLARGLVSNDRVVFDLTDYNITGAASGLTADTDGNLWIALFSAAAVIQVNPNTHKLLRTVPIPARNVTNAVFGGPEMNILFVGTTPEMAQTNINPFSGAIFTVEGLGVTGVPAYRAVMNSDCTPVFIR